MRIAKFVTACLCLMLGTGVAQAATVTVLISGGFRAAYDQLAPAYEKQRHNELVSQQSPSMGNDPTAIPARLARHEPADLVIMVRSALDGLVKQGLIVPDSVTDLGIGKVAMAVKAGAPKPDISTMEAFKETLLRAKSLAVSDSASGVYFRTVLFRKLGIDKEMQPKTHTIQATPVGLNIARGEYEIGIQQFSELKPIPGIEIVGLIPDAVQLPTPYSAGLVKAAPNRAGGRDLIRYLASPASYAAIRDSGMVPAQDKK
ncbi:MAG TPA: substrate-binding domain-containing protein [Bryobacteraceae bacterium]|nr:substrate-binding domain-containing protein [Bryobacteraceae bacterium]